MRSLLAIAHDNKTDKITLPLVIKNDLLPWLASSTVTLLLFVGVGTLVGSAISGNKTFDPYENLYSHARLFYIMLVTLACFLARRSRSFLTWVFAVILIMFFIPQTHTTIATTIFPNSILPALIAMIGCLCIERILTYIHMRYAVKLNNISVSRGSLSCYGILTVLSIIFVM